MPAGSAKEELFKPLSPTFSIPSLPLPELVCSVLPQPPHRSCAQWRIGCAGQRGGASVAPNIWGGERRVAGGVIRPDGMHVDPDDVSGRRPGLLPPDIEQQAGGI